MRRAVLVLLAVAGLGALLAVWRLRQGPVSIDALVPTIEQAFNAADARLYTDVDRAAVAFVSWRHPIGLALYGVRVGEPGTSATVSLPSLFLGLSGRALLKGTIAPAWIEIREPVVQLKRAAEGDVEVTLVPGETITRDSEEGGVFERLLGALANASESRGVLGYLESLEIVRGEVHVTDEASSRTLRAMGMALSLRRVSQGVSGTLDTDAAFEQDTVELSATFLYRTEEGVADVTVAVQDVDTETLAFLLPAGLADTVDLQVTLAASADLSVGLTGDLRSARFELQAGPGTVRAPDWWTGPRSVQRLYLRGQLEGPALTISEAELGLRDGETEPVELTGTAAAVRSETGDSLTTELRIPKLAVAAIGSFWPQHAAPGARRWVTSNVHAGAVQDVRLNIALDSFHGGEGEHVRLRDVQGSFAFDALAVSAVDFLPEVKGLAGTATLTASELSFDITRGQIGGVKLEGGRVDVVGMGSGQERVDVAAQAVGASAEVLRVAVPALMDVLGVVGPASQGETFVQASVRVPLGTAGGLDDTALTMTADLGTVRIEHPMFSADVVGDVRFGGEPGRARTLELDLTLLEPNVSLPLIGTQQSTAGYRGRAQVAARIVDRRMREVWIVDLDAGAVRTQGRILFDESGQAVVAADLEKVQAGETNLSDVRAQLESGAIDVAIGAGVLDVSAFSLPGAGEDTEEEAGVDLRLRAPQLQRVQFAPNRFLEGVSFEVQRQGGTWESIKVAGNVPDSLRTNGAGGRRGRGSATRSGGDFRFDWNRAADASGTLRAHAGDVGALFRATNLSEGILGGELHVSGGAAADRPSLVRAHATGTGFTLTSSSIIFRVLAIASGRGILQSSTGDRVPFDEMSADLVFDGGVLGVEQAIARGTVFAVTAEGDLDFRKRSVDVNGEIVPAYELTRHLRRVPVVGELLIGKGGVIGVVYRARGALAEPAISVDPLSTLTPTLIRRLIGREGREAK